MFDASFSVENSIVPGAFHDSIDFVFGFGMGDGVEDAFAVVGITSPGAFVDGEEFVGGDGEHDAVGSMAHGFYAVAEIVVPVI